MVLGDSHTAGGQVSYEQNHTALIEDRLHASGYTQVRVFNAGIGGCGTFCQARVLRENVDWMQPDLVVVSVVVGNNIVENVLAGHGGYRDAPEHPQGVTWGPAAEHAGLPVLDLLPVLRSRADGAQLYLRLDTHFSALGYQVAAEELASFLEQSGWLHEPPCRDRSCWGDATPANELRRPFMKSLARWAATDATPCSTVR